MKHIFYILLIKSESMSTLCQWSIVHVDHVKGDIVHVEVMSRVCQGRKEVQCRRWLPLFDVKHIFYILLIKSESMSTLCQWSIVHVDVMSREILSMSTIFQGSKTYFLYFINKKRIHVDVMSREILFMSTLCQGRYC